MINVRVTFVAALLGLAASVLTVQPGNAADAPPSPRWAMPAQAIQPLPWGCHGEANKPHSITGGIGFDAYQDCVGNFDVQKVCTKLQEKDYYGTFYDRTAYRCSPETVRAHAYIGWSVTCAAALEGIYRTAGLGFVWPDGVQHVRGGYSDGVLMCRGYGYGYRGPVWSMDDDGNNNGDNGDNPANAWHLRLGGGQTLAATVASRGAVRYAPRELTLFLSESTSAVRRPDGGLVWLESDRLTAFPSDAGVVQVSHTDGPDSPAALVPRDTGTEAAALRDLRSVCAWLDAQVDDDTPAHPSEYLGRRCDLRRLEMSDGRSAEVAVDSDTGIVLSVRGRSLRGGFTVEVTSLSTAGVEPQHLLPR